MHRQRHTVDHNAPKWAHTRSNVKENSQSIRSSVKKRGVKVHMKDKRNNKRAPKTPQQVAAQEVKKATKSPQLGLKSEKTNAKKQTQSNCRKRRSEGQSAKKNSHTMPKQPHSGLPNKLIGVQTSASHTAQTKQIRHAALKYRQSFSERSGSFGADFVLTKY